MTPMFEELDYRTTPMGALSLRRRQDLAGGPDIYEVKLGEAFLMSSRFTAAEEALATIALGEISSPPCDVVVGGLGLGHTAAAVLDDPAVRSLVVVEALPEVIDWHRRGLLPLGPRLVSDPRCRLVEGDFFALAAARAGFDPDVPYRKVDAVLVDIDHSPRNFLHPRHAGFYTRDGLDMLSRHLKEGGIFGLWSNDGADDGFMDVLSQVFASVRAEDLEFPSSDPARPASNTIYLARRAAP